MSRKQTGKDTLAILEAGGYTAPSGTVVDIADMQAAAVAGTRLYVPETRAALVAGIPPGTRETQIEVTDEKCQTAASRLVLEEGHEDIVMLNFASARNPGGGFLGGARAQEEDICRCSGLFPCLLTQPTYYQVNRQQRSLLYTDHLIYSPAVPFFRAANSALLDTAYPCAVITSPAPNTGPAMARNPDIGPALEAAFRQRAAMILAVAATHGHRVILLGAWGCGAFRGDPILVSQVFWDLLRGPFLGTFDRVIFPVFDPGKTQPNLHAFRERFAQW